MAQNPYLSQSYRDEWETDPDCKWFKEEMKHLNSLGTAWTNLEIFRQRLMARDLLIHNKSAFDYAGWYLTNITYDLFPNELKQ